MVMMCKQCSQRIPLAPRNSDIPLAPLMAIPPSTTAAEKEMPLTRRLRDVIEHPPVPATATVMAKPDSPNKETIQEAVVEAEPQSRTLRLRDHDSSFPDDEGPTLPLAGLGQRYLARLIDVFLLFGAIVLVVYLTNNPERSNESEDDASDKTNTRTQQRFAPERNHAQENLVWLTVALVILIQVVILSRQGQTVGKYLVGIQIVESATGKPAGFLRGCLLRGALSILAIFPYDRLGIHDQYSGTCVVSVR